MRLHSIGLALVSAALSALCAGCPDDGLECESNDMCLQGGIDGVCLPSPASSKKWCAFPDPACATGHRWGVVTGDGLAAECVESVPGVDGGPDASVDAAVDASLDTTPPLLVTTLPANGGSDESTATVITATFSEAIEPSSIDASSFVVSVEGGSPVAGSFGVDGAVVTFTPTASLTAEALYVATLTSGVADLAGNHLADETTWSFTTRAGGWTERQLLESELNMKARDLAVASSGDTAVAIWLMSPCNGNICQANAELWASVYSAGTWSASTKIVATAGTLITPRIAIDSAGRATAVWTQRGATFDSIAASRYEAATGWSVPLLIETEESGDAAFPAIAMAANGSAAAVWRQSDGTHTNVWANRFTVGSGWGAATKLEGIDDAVGDRPAIAMAADGSALAIWSQASTMWASRLSAGTWSTPTSIGAASAGGSRSVVEFSPDGSAIAAWTSPADVLAARFSGTWAAAQTLDASSGSVVAGLDIGMAPDGKALVVWHQTVGSQNTMQALFDPGVGWGSAYSIDSAAPPSNGATVAFDANGFAMSTWTQAATANAGQVLFASRFRPASGWGAPQVVQTNPAEGVAEASVSYTSGSNSFHAVWIQSGSGYPSVYASRFE